MTGGHAVLKQHAERKRLILYDLPGDIVPATVGKATICQLTMVHLFDIIVT
jgi:hypothetical protein